MSHRHKILVFLFFLMQCVCLNGAEYRYSRIIAYEPVTDTTAIHTGLDLLIQHQCQLIRDKKVALVVNTASHTRDDVHAIDVLSRELDTNLVSIIDILAQPLLATDGGSLILHDESARSAKYVCVTPQNPKVHFADLAGAEVILFDAMGLGVASDVNLAVLYSLLKISATRRVALVLLDRPNPLTAHISAGPLMTDSTGFVTRPIPWRYGTTLAELALMLNEEQALKAPKPARLYIVPMVNYHREHWFDETDLPWRLPIKEMYTIEELLLYLTIEPCKYTNLSGGQGSRHHYSVVGAPWLSGKQIVEQLQKSRIEGAAFQVVKFTPGIMTGRQHSGLYFGQECSGIRIHVTNRAVCDPLMLPAILLDLIARQYPHHFKWQNPRAIDYLFGDSSYRLNVESRRKIDYLFPLWTARLTDYQKRLIRYRLYHDR